VQGSVEEEKSRGNVRCWNRDGDFLTKVVVRGGSWGAHRALRALCQRSNLVNVLRGGALGKKTLLLRDRRKKERAQVEIEPEQGHPRVNSEENSLERPGQAGGNICRREAMRAQRRPKRRGGSFGDPRGPGGLRDGKDRKGGACRPSKGVRRYFIQPGELTGNPGKRKRESRRGVGSGGSRVR